VLKRPVYFEVFSNFAISLHARIVLEIDQYPLKSTLKTDIFFTYLYFSRLDAKEYLNLVIFYFNEWHVLFLQYVLNFTISE